MPFACRVYYIVAQRPRLFNFGTSKHLAVERQLAYATVRGVHYAPYWFWLLEVTSKLLSWLNHIIPFTNNYHKQASTAR
jgi:hypothetical protein